MTNMARIIDGAVTEVLKPISGFDIADCFHPDVLIGCVPCGDDVQPGWVLTGDGFAAPEPEPEEEAPAEEVPADTPPTT
jgi:hypothetical protein